MKTQILFRVTHPETPEKATSSMGKKHRQRRLSHKSRRWPRSWRRNPSSAKPARADHQHHKGQNHHHCHPVAPQTETHHFKITDLKYDRHPHTDKYDPEDQSPLANHADHHDHVRHHNRRQDGSEGNLAATTAHQRVTYQDDRELNEAIRIILSKTRYK